MPQVAKFSLQEEQQLVSKAKQDLNEFDPLYQHYLPKIYRYLSFKTSDASVAEDLTAQTFCEALENLQSYEWKGISFGAWLYRIAYNLLMDHYRLPGQEPLEEHEHLSDPLGDVEDEVNQNWSLAKVYEALKTLPESAQQVVALRVTEGLSHKEIALILGKSEDSVKMNYSRAIQALKEKIVFIAFLIFAGWRW